MAANRKKLALVGAIVLALAAVALVFWKVKGGGADGAGSSAAGGKGVAGGGGAGRGKVPPIPGLAKREADHTVTASEGKVIHFGRWGSGPGEFGHRPANESNPEGPMSLAAGRKGEILVLDQVNARIQRFRPDGTLAGEIKIGPETAQDLSVGPNGEVSVLDRVGQGELHLFDENGEQRSTIPVAGGPLEEAGTVTGVFHTPDGIYLEREHTELIKVAEGDGKPVEDRGSEPGRPSRDGNFFLSASLADQQGGKVLLRVFTKDATVLWSKVVAFPKPIVHLLLLDTDLKGHLYLAAYLAREKTVEPYELYDDEVLIYRMNLADGTPLGALSIPPNRQPEEVFRELSVDDNGVIYQLLVTEQGTEVRTYTFP